MKHRLHVNRQNIAINRKSGSSDRTVFTLKNYKENMQGHHVVLRDKQGNVILEGVYSPEKPLNCGAVLWMEFDDKNVEIEVT
jgi:hypothetical protein